MKQLQLGFGLDSFGDAAQVRPVRHVHDEAHDLTGTRVVPHRGNKLPVNLQILRGETAQVGQGGVARAEVVDAQRNPQVEGKPGYGQF